VLYHFPTSRLQHQSGACATDAEGERQENDKKLTQQSGEEPFGVSLLLTD